MNAELIAIQIALFLAFVFAVYLFLTKMAKKHWPNNYIHLKEAFLNIVNIVAIFVVFIFVMVKVFTMVNYGPKYTVEKTRLPDAPEQQVVQPSQPFVEEVNRTGQFEARLKQND